MLSCQKLLTSANIFVNLIFPERFLFRVCRKKSIFVLTGYKLAGAINRSNVQDSETNNVPEITGTFRYWPMLEIIGGKALGLTTLTVIKDIILSQR